MALQPCAECGAQISDLAKACPKCGAPVGVSPTQAVSAPAVPKVGPNAQRKQPSGRQAGSWLLYAGIGSSFAAFTLMRLSPLIGLPVAVIGVVLAVIGLRKRGPQPLVIIGLLMTICMTGYCGWVTYTSVVAVRSAAKVAALGAAYREIVAKCNSVEETTGSWPVSITEIARARRLSEATIADIVYVQPLRHDPEQPVLIQGPVSRTTGPVVVAMMDGSTRVLDAAKATKFLQAASRLVARGTAVSAKDWNWELE